MRHKTTQRVYAMKLLSKFEMVNMFVPWQLLDDHFHLLIYIFFYLLDQKVRFCILLGRTRYHGPCKLRMDCTITFCLSRHKISLHGYGLYARWRSRKSHVKLWCAREMGKILLCRSCPRSRCHPFNGFRSQVIWITNFDSFKCIFFTIIIFL